MHPSVPLNSTQTELDEEHVTTEFSPRERSMLTSMVAIAALLANFPVVYFVNHYGIRTVFSTLGILSALSTLLMPTAIRLGFYYFLVLRFLQGVAFAANFPVIGSFASKWTYYKQNGLFVSCLVAYVQLSPAITMPASGGLCTAFGWPSVFYAHGVFSLVLFVTYAVFYRNNPKKHPFVGVTEAGKISIGKLQMNKEDLKRIPYAAILRSLPVWAVWVASIGNFTAVNTMFLYSPIYLNRVLGFPVHKTGLSAALPPLAQFCMKLFCGATSDKIRFISETNKLRLYNSVAFFGSAVFLVTLALMDTEYNNACMMVLGAGAGILGATTGGFFKAGPMISKQYSHFVTGNVSLGITITMLVVPLMVGGVAPDNTAAEWSWVWIIVATVLVLTNLFFTFYGSGEPCEWTTEAYVQRNSVASISKDQLPKKAEVN
uniref:MFS domain-containing protein n=1 Tax=Steinernema glaseri TaxID=37863 RepID=A0A1I8AIQ3_9BILA